MNWKEVIDAIDSREKLVDFLVLLQEDLDTKSEEWENDSLPSYLWAMQRWVVDMDGYYRNNSIDMSQENVWKMLATMLYAAKIYE